MIPPSNTMDDSIEREDELGNTEQPHSPASTSSQESKLQKLKKSLSFKKKSIRSKSADNFFQRTNSDMKFHADSEPDDSPTSTRQTQSSETPSTTPTKVTTEPTENKAHIFQEHVFKKPTFCDVCNHMIVGASGNAGCSSSTAGVGEHGPSTHGTIKHGLRCKACKMSIHHKCTETIGSQRCMGKLPKGFRRYYSSPLLIHEQFGCIKEVMPIACGNKVDPVYETLRFGTSLAQKTKKSSSGSGSDSPNRSSNADLIEVPEEGDNSYLLDVGRPRSDSVFSDIENGTESFNEEQQRKEIHLTVPIFKDSGETYVALYKFDPQENEDLALRPGDRITVIDNSNEDWWKGKADGRIGYFPANFVQKIQENERFYRCTRTFIGCKEQGQITIKENQICSSTEKEHNGFLKVLSGKKKGFVPTDALENI